jgi:hypothetical protein
MEPECIDLLVQTSLAGLTHLRIRINEASISNFAIQVSKLPILEHLGLTIHGPKSRKGLPAQDSNNDKDVMNRRPIFRLPSLKRLRVISLKTLQEIGDFVDCNKLERLSAPLGLLDISHFLLHCPLLQHVHGVRCSADDGFIHPLSSESKQFDELLSRRLLETHPQRVMELQRQQQEQTLFSSSLRVLNINQRLALQYSNIMSLITTFPAIEELHLNVQHHTDPKTMRLILHFLPRLRTCSVRLVVNSNSKKTALATASSCFFDIEHKNLQDLSTDLCDNSTFTDVVLPSLHRLEIGGISDKITVSRVDLRNLFVKTAPNLKTFIARRTANLICSSSSGSLLSEGLHHSVRCVDLDSVAQFDDTALMNLLEFVRPQILRIHNCHHMSQHIIPVIAQTCWQISVIDLSFDRTNMALAILAHWMQVMICDERRSSLNLRLEPRTTSICSGPMGLKVSQKLCLKNSNGDYLYKISGIPNEQYEYDPQDKTLLVEDDDHTDYEFDDDDDGEGIDG